MNFEKIPQKQIPTILPKASEESKRLREEHPSGFKRIKKQGDSCDNISNQLDEIFDGDNDSLSNYNQSESKDNDE